MSYNYGYNGDTDFLRWYKKNYGADYSDEAGFSRKEGMSDAEYDVGSQLYNSYLSGRELDSQRTEQKNTVDTKYNNAITDVSNSAASSREALGDSKNRSEEHAYITHQRLQKYLPMIDKTQGYGGAGAQGTAGLKAYNEYMTQMGSIGSEYDKNLRAINESETAKKAELERYRTSELGSIDEKFDGLSRDLSKDTDTDVRAMLDKYYKQDYEAADTMVKNTDSRNMTDFEADFRQKYGAIFDEPTMSAFLAVAGNKINDNVKADDKEQYESVYRYLAASPSSSADELKNYVNSMYPEGAADPNYNELMAYAESFAKKNADAERANAPAADEIATQIDKMIEQGTSWAVITKYYNKNAENMTPSDKEKYKDLLNTYGQIEEMKKKTVTAGVIFNENGSKIKNRGDDFSLTYMSPDGDTYIWRVQNGGKVTDENILLLSTAMPDKEVFAYNSKYYIKYGDSVYLIAPRNYNHYEMMEEVLAGSYQMKTEGKGWTANGTLR